MPVTFSQSMRSLEADHFRRVWWCLAVGAVFLATLLGWGFWGRIQVYEISSQARLEVERAAHPVAAPLAGRVIATHLELGKAVKAGDVLIQLDAQAGQLRLTEEQVHLTGLNRRAQAMSDEIRAEKDSWLEEQKSADAAIEEARSRHTEALAATRFASEELARLKTLAADGVISQTDLDRAGSHSEQKNAATSALAQAVKRLGSEEQAKEKFHQSRLAKLQSDLVTLESESETRTEGLRRVEFEIRQHRILAPVSGHLAEAANLRQGSFVTSGQTIGTILPEGELKAVALFPPLAALGRIHAGQLARLRLDGFHWTQFGSVAAKVIGVASEPRDGQVRVEFSVAPDSAPRIPMQHGLPGSMEVTVEQVSPASLLFRTIGNFLTANRATTP